MLKYTKSKSDFLYAKGNGGVGMGYVFVFYEVNAVMFF